jgi:hypothetical protein
MTETALFVSQTAEKGGAELFMLDLIRRGPLGWNGGFFSDGPMVRELTAAGRTPVVLSGGSSVSAVRREASALKLISVAGGVVALARSLARAAKGYDVVCANSRRRCSSLRSQRG